MLNEVVLAEPRGFCAGVDRAIEIVERALVKFGAPIYVRHEIVHNTYVVNDLKAKGAIFIEELAEVPVGATLVFSAHGVSQAVRREAAERGFSIFDATCPLVTKVHVEVAKLHKEGYEFLMIGHKGHPEVEGTMGQLFDGIYLVEDVADVASAPVQNPERLAVVTASALILPALTCGTAVGGEENISCVWPAIRSIIAGAPPLYGTWTMSIPAMLLNNSPDRWPALPLPDEP